MHFDGDMVQKADGEWKSSFLENNELTLPTGIASDPILIQ